VFDEKSIPKGRLIEKEYVFPVCKGELPLLSAKPTDVRSDFLAEKEYLNSVKHQLDDKDLDMWGKHTSKTNLMGSTIFKLRDVVNNSEMVTIAWAKLYEILKAYDVIPQTLPRGDMRSMLSSDSIVTPQICSAGLDEEGCDLALRSIGSLGPVLWSAHSTFARLRGPSSVLPTITSRLDMHTLNRV